MTRNTPSLHVLKPQVTTPRPAQFETPDSYLARLCAANVIDVDYIRRMTTHRRRQTARPEELGHVIAELGGPEPGHFQRDYTRALIQPAPPAPDAFATSQRTRQACSRCAAGDEILTYDHRRFMICLSHNRWIGIQSAEQQQIVHYELRTVERRYRRIMAGGLIPTPAHDAVVAAIDRYSLALGEHLWLGHRRHRHSGIDRFPARTRVLETIAAYLAQNWPLQREIAVWHRRPEQRRLYDHFRTQLTWLGRAADNWKFIDELVQIVIDIIGDRADPFAGYALELGTRGPPARPYLEATQPLLRSSLAPDRDVTAARRQEGTALPIGRP
jgi:hypothetical protein